MIASNVLSSIEIGNLFLMTVPCIKGRYWWRSFQYEATIATLHNEWIIMRSWSDKITSMISITMVNTNHIKTDLSRIPTMSLLLLRLMSNKWMHAIRNQSYTIVLCTVCKTIIIIIHQLSKPITDLFSPFTLDICFSFCERGMNWLS